ncbi:MAG: Flp family type IVb pilin [Dehalococcoidales bacterium]|nr:Flp family type IVb pilin [Dehalococcoidales bacterium]
MAYLMSLLQSVRREEEGQGLVEYALILVLIAIAVIVILGLLGEQISTTFSTVVSGLK